MKRKIQKIVFVSAKVLLFCVAVLIASELILHASESFQKDKTQAAMHKLLRRVGVRINERWLRTNPNSDPFVPPLLVFSNKDFDKPERLKEVFEATKLPPSRTWVSHDFLQDESRANDTQYIIHSNSLGFRGREYTREKPDGTYRIIALGAYHVFGHGVGDNEAYPARLEQELNKNIPDKKFEVWNGGRHAGTAIVGLARMKNEIFNYKPDMLILDYGFLDTTVFGDNFLPAGLRLPDSPTYVILR
ncbi:hypothetical protein HY024_01900, partial [Candidatus Curtissbacteria bacterium]|nr:hypothetical protein [Candidatus Curtissbacteria bacterium]